MTDKIEEPQKPFLTDDVLKKELFDYMLRRDSVYAAVTLGELEYLSKTLMNIIKKHRV